MNSTAPEVYRGYFVSKILYRGRYLKELRVYRGYEECDGMGATEIWEIEPINGSLEAGDKGYWRYCGHNRGEEVKIDEIQIRLVGGTEWVSFWDIKDNFCEWDTGFEGSWYMAEVDEDILLGFKHTGIYIKGLELAWDFTEFVPGYCYHGDINYVSYESRESMLEGRYYIYYASKFKDMRKMGLGVLEVLDLLEDKEDRWAVDKMVVDKVGEEYISTYSNGSYWLRRVSDSV